MTAALRKWRRLAWPDRALLCEAVLLLAIARVAIAALPFRWLVRLLGRGDSAAAPLADMPEALITRVRWAVVAGARRVPWRAVCFQQGVAAHWMLRRRGVPSVLYYGTAPTLTQAGAAKGLAAHVWVRAGALDVIGGEVAGRFAVLARFPLSRPRAAP
ncbi:hypothetical protein GCM10011611_10240 [Aliidongia dinghuensis]|uniref:Microcin J25-processing protein McjB C-terminal domain-containing protein n=1 Tax=Aliidongia dinghuensis TaxID=1867774 RepID=A0A8J2YR91_9PROT|nr:lasso peptide biosynthesis B2 protein [Aliidongia dinghuensis]GGF06706.1 hypothetical protein GCM10011611_10240 [Aliidongia dinghuensis]